MEDIKKTVAELPTLDRPKLLDLWHVNFGKAAPVGIRRELIVPILAYRIQERAYGGLKKETIVKLRSWHGNSIGSHPHRRERIE